MISHITVSNRDDNEFVSSLYKVRHNLARKIENVTGISVENILCTHFVGL